MTSIVSDQAPPRRTRSLSEMSLRERRRAARERMTGEPAPEKTRRRDAAATKKPLAERPTTKRRTGQPPGVYYMILALISLFVMFGLVMVLSASATTQASAGNSPYRPFIRQAVWAVLGVVIGLAVSRISYERWRMISLPGFTASLALMIATFIPGIGSEINGAQSWLSVGPFSFQPSELMKLMLIMILASHFHKHRDDLNQARVGLYPLAGLVGVGAGIAFLQGDLGSAVVIGAIGLGVGLIAGLPLVHLGMLTFGATALSAVAVVSDTRRMNRILAFLDVEGNKGDIAYQIYQSKLSIANGSWFGSGIGQSRSKFGFLPYAHSDFIFAVVADELGAVGAVAVIGGFVLLVYAGMQVALAAPDRFGMLLAGGIATWFGVQALVHLGGVSGVMPVTGLTLPFFSAGGSSLLVSIVAAGLLLNVARHAVTDTDERVIS